MRLRHGLPGRGRVLAWALALIAVSLPAGGEAAGATGIWTGDPSFTDDRGRAVRGSEFLGRRTVVTMAYSTCRRTCSFTLRKLQAMQSEADERREPLEFVVVSLDPDRDTPAAWTRYRKQNRLARSNWHFLSGTTRATRDLAARVGLGDYWTYDDHVLHDFAAVIVDGDGRIERRLDWKDLAER